MSIRIGTRGSKLALAQTSTVCKKLPAKGIDTEQVIITTQGDAVTGVPLHEIGGQGVFVRALDDAILAGSIDCAVHSMKDIPAYRPSGVVTAAVLKRDSPADYLAYNGSLRAVKVIGTSSTRRRAQMLRHDPEITTKDLRGNVDTRIRKMSAGECDAVLLAEAGLARLGIRIPGERLSPEKFVPPPTRGRLPLSAGHTLPSWRTLRPRPSPDPHGCGDREGGHGRTRRRMFHPARHLLPCRAPDR